FLYLLFFLIPGVALAFEIPGFELVYTAPAETSLQNPDLRNPVDVWVELINGAQKTIDFEELYASSKAGEPLEKVLEAMESAAARGVKIRFILEKSMLRACYPGTITRLEKIKNLELRLLDFGKLHNGGLMHAKYFVVDGKTAYMGSQNFDWRSLKHIHETGLKITDVKISSQLHAIFEFDWKAWETLRKGQKVSAGQTKPLLAKEGERAFLAASPLALLPPGIVNSEAELLSVLDGAMKEIRIQVLEYYPLDWDHRYYAAIDDALRAAAARGVKVRLMISHWNQGQPGINYLKSLAILPNVAVEIVTIPMAKEGAIPFARVNHSKFAVIDDKIAWIGTSNWTGGYFDQLRNVEIVIHDAQMAKRLAALHEQLWVSPYGATLDILKEYPKPNKGD
ncbi:MAG: phospholipase D-like domain-containing protein, partial [Bdellovibrionota bacterium]